MPVRLPIFYLEFPTRHLVAATFLRFQEHYESPKFRGTCFSWEVYMDWYAATYGAFTYTDDWDGFNVPSWVFTPFRQGRFGRLTMKERALLRILPATAEPFYAIASHKERQAHTLGHEIAHGHFFLVPAYAEDVRGCIAQERVLAVPEFRSWLGDLGYAESVHEDEMNAYLMDGLPKEIEGLRYALAPLRIKLEATFRRHFGFSPLELGDPDVCRRAIRRIPYSRFARELKALAPFWGAGTP